MQPADRSNTRVYWLVGGGLLMCCLALLPWWRNHDYLRDLYDYGGFMAVNARLDAGERPYVDFGTPIQSGMFLFNFAAERIGGGTYVGMTWGAAVVAVAAIFGLGLMLARRWRPPLAMFVAGAVVIGTVSQHTIIFYNALGVLALALVTWSFALAPLLRREDLGWHVLAGVGLFLGGITKLNFHLVACAMAAGWVLFAWTGQKSTGRRALGTLLLIGVCGFVLPVAVELLWTGASPRQWYQNVIELPFLSRSGRMSLLFSGELYLTTVNDFYGPQFRQAGLVGLILVGATVIAAWRSPVLSTLGWRRVLVIAAGLLAALAGAALLATNNEITYVALAASVVLAVSLWLGFGLAPRGGWFVAGFLLPVLLLAAYGWQSAWRGQRSQFGHSASPRSSYLAAETVGPDFGYLRGLHVPPTIVQSLKETVQWRKSLPGEMRSRIFFGPGLEWLDRIWPMRKVRGLALSQNAFVKGAQERALFDREVLGGGAYHYLLVSEAWNHWDPDVELELAHHFLKMHVGTAFFAYEILPAGTVNARPFDYRAGFGGNVDSTLLRSAMKVQPLSGKRQFLGITQGHGEVKLDVRSHRAAGEIVLKRINPAVRPVGTVRFEIFASEGSARYPRWAKEVPLPAEQDEITLPSDIIDASSQPVVFTVTIPDALAGQVVAGWRALALADSMDGPDLPPVLVPDTWQATEASPGIKALMLPPGLKAAPVYLRNTWVEDGVVKVRPGGEIWVRLPGLFSKISIVMKSIGRTPATTDQVVRVIYYKGGRLDEFATLVLRGDAPVALNAWSPANDGWLAVLADPAQTAALITVKIESVERP